MENERIEPQRTETAGELVEAFDDVKHPRRYNKGAVECIDAIESAVSDCVGIEAVCIGNAIKYLWRWKDKEQIKSLEKAKWYIDRLIAHLKKGA